jgi:hypothetical protein
MDLLLGVGDADPGGVELLFDLAGGVPEDVLVVAGFDPGAADVVLTRRT